MNNTVNRNISFDILRIISALSIVVMHITSGNLYSLEMGSAAWRLSALINSVSHFGVPVFVMISGALFLAPDREINIKKLWLHNILRLFCAYLIWSIIYGSLDYLTYRNGFRGYLWCAVVARPHLWFLLMLIGIYIISPILIRWVRAASEKEVRYFIIIFVIFQIFCETLKIYIPADIVQTVIDLRNIELVCSYVGYFVIGYYIVHVGLKKVFRYALYLLGLLGILSSIFMLTFISIKRGVPVSEIVDSYSSFTFFYSTALFTFVYKVFEGKEIKPIVKKIVSGIGIDTFGLYLSHILIIENFSALSKLHDSMMLVPGIIFYAIAIFTVGILGSALIRRIPFIGRYIC
ncbi:MAG: acyltransferase family protein [Lachnospiraceae bacterium]|nr:acyltransferase family protein [Lachnospiraceae bacterium]